MMPNMKKKAIAKNSATKSKPKTATKKAKTIAKISPSPIATLSHTRPTKKELSAVAKKVMKQYSLAIKNLARR